MPIAIGRHLKEQVGNQDTETSPSNSNQFQEAHEAHLRHQATKNLTGAKAVGTSNEP